MQAAPLPDFEKAQTRAASWLRAWDRQGLHRTGTAGDLAGAEWLGQEAMALGAEVWVEEFALDRVDPVECFVEFGVRQIAAVPVFDAPSTDPGGLSGRLGAIGGRSRCVPRNVTTTLRATADVRLLTLTRRAGRRCAIASNTAGRSVLATCKAGGP